MDNSINKRKQKGSKTSLTLGHKCKKYRKQFHNQIQSNCTSGILPPLSPTISFPATSDNPIESNTFANGPNANFQLHHPTIYVKETSNVEIQTASIETVNKFTQTEGNSVDMCDVFMQSEQIDNYQQSKSTQFNLRDFLSGKKLQSHQYLNSIIDFLNDTEIGIKFATFLENNKQTMKFLSTIKAIALGKLKCSNMSWKAALDMGYLSTCETTSEMVYDKEWLEFCQVVYHMFGGGIINTLCGRVHFSHVTSEKSLRGLFKPVEGEFNFPVPSITMLKKLDIGYPTEVPVGIIQHSLDLACEHVEAGNEFILSFDGKLISPGCKGYNTGDCDMWGREGSPNLPKAL